MSCSDHLQAAKALRDDKLSPESEIYRLSQWKRFQGYIREVPALMDKLPPDVGRYLVKEWVLVDKCVLKRGRNDGLGGWSDACGSDS